MGRILHKIKKPVPSTESRKAYDRFDELNGWHSWQEAVPEGCVLYPTRKLNKGEVLYFNFALAKEMGLIDSNHKNQLNKNLEKKILETFCIRIINEYDNSQNIKYHPTVKKENPYMATRYLQLQHADKAGRTSGDGRSIWNGEVSHRGQTWDVSSRGTGVTKLAPGFVEAQKPLKSGSNDFGYGCGLADVDELIGAAILAEIFHNKGIRTERVLAVIDIGGGNGIGVRAAPNLFRPAHLFSFLKQGDITSLKKATDYIYQRQIKNKDWPICATERERYNHLLEMWVNDFAKFAAMLDRDYIFAWLDWDGDNVLINAGIIDYGSIRQFGLRHDEYRYDDVDRFSSNLNEQKKKTERIIQTFAQLVDFLNSGSKKSIENFQNHSAIKRFQSIFKNEILKIFLLQMGFDDSQVEIHLKKNRALVEKLYVHFRRLESRKTRKPKRKVPDGVNRPAILNMRHFLLSLPKTLLENSYKGAIQNLTGKTLFGLALAKSARGADRNPNAKIDRELVGLQKMYLDLLHSDENQGSIKQRLKKLVKNATLRNPDNRITGDGLLHIVDEILKKRKKAASTNVTQKTIDRIVDEQSPRQKFAHTHDSKEISRLLETVISLIDGHKESI